MPDETLSKYMSRQIVRDDLDMDALEKTVSRADLLIIMSSIMQAIAHTTMAVGDLASGKQADVDSSLQAARKALNMAHEAIVESVVKPGAFS